MNQLAVLLLVIITTTSLGQTNIHEVHMVGMKFVPSNIMVRKGDTIKFINDSNMQHNAVFDFVETKLIKKGESVQVKFDKVGEFPYFCRPHKSAGMKGIITVKD